MTLPADKGNATVIIDMAVYKGKTSALLNDQDTYVRLTRDLTLKVERALLALLADMFHFALPKRKSSHYAFLWHSGAAPGLYGLMCPCVQLVISPAPLLTSYPDTACTKFRLRLLERAPRM